MPACATVIRHHTASYRRVDAALFRWIVLVLLAISGLALVAQCLA
jgi:hypothetical protein